MAKKYYWLKVKEDFFRQKEIKKLRRLENGDSYVLIYLKMLLLSLRSENKLVFDNVEDTFAEELSLELDEDLEDIQVLLEFLKNQKLIEYVSEDEYFLPQGNDLTGSECDSAQRVRKHREKKKEEKNIKENKQNNNSDDTKTRTYKWHNAKSSNASDCNGNNECNKNITTEKEKEKEIEIDKEIDTEIDKEIDTDTELDTNIKADMNQEICISPEPSVSMCVSTEKKSTNENLASEYVNESMDENLSQIVKLYEENIGPVYPANRDWFIEISQKIEPALFNRAIEICIDRCNVTPSYLKGIIRKWTHDNILTLGELKSKEIERKNRDNLKKFNNKSQYKTSEEVDEDEEIDEELLAEVKALEEKLGVC